MRKKGDGRDAATLPTDCEGGDSGSEEEDDIDLSKAVPRAWTKWEAVNISGRAKKFYKCPADPSTAGMQRNSTKLVGWPLCDTS